MLVSKFSRHSPEKPIRRLWHCLKQSNFSTKSKSKILANRIDNIRTANTKEPYDNLFIIQTQLLKRMNNNVIIKLWTRNETTIDMLCSYAIITQHSVRQRKRLVGFWALFSMRAGPWDSRKPKLNIILLSLFRLFHQNMLHAKLAGGRKGTIYVRWFFMNGNVLNEMSPIKFNSFVFFEANFKFIVHIHSSALFAGPTDW